MSDIPDSTAVRVALWRALHTEIDAAPPVLADDLGLRLAAPSAGWRDRPDMHPQGTRGVGQYVILGAGLDTFAQRRSDVAVRVFEIDRPATQRWKRNRI